MTVKGIERKRDECLGWLFIYLYLHTQYGVGNITRRIVIRGDLAPERDCFVSLSASLRVATARGRKYFLSFALALSCGISCLISLSVSEVLVIFYLRAHQIGISSVFSTSHRIQQPRGKETLAATDFRSSSIDFLFFSTILGSRLVPTDWVSWNMYTWIYIYIFLPRGSSLFFSSETPIAPPGRIIPSCTILLPVARSVPA